MKILRLTRLHPPTQTRLEAAYDVVEAPADVAELQYLLHRDGADIQGLVTNGKGRVDTDLLAYLPNLRVVSCFGAGTDNVDRNALAARGIVLRSTGPALHADVADHAVSLLLNLLRGTARAEAALRGGDWDAGRGLTRSLGGRLVGIVGLGGIGIVVARRLTAFDQQISYTGRAPKPNAPYRYTASLTELAGWCDVLIVTCPGGDATRHLINSEVLHALGPNGVLVNVSRGSVVDEVALIDALSKDRIAGAALDVFETEPHVPAALLNDPRVVLTPHVASATVEARTRMGEMMIAGLEH